MLQFDIFYRHVTLCKWSVQLIEGRPFSTKICTAIYSKNTICISNLKLCRASESDLTLTYCISPKSPWHKLAFDIFSTWIGQCICSGQRKAIGVTLGHVISTFTELISILIEIICLSLTVGLILPPTFGCPSC